MKFNQRKYLRYRIIFWVVITLAAFPFVPVQLLGALGNTSKKISAVGSCFADSGRIDEYKRFKKFEEWSS